MGDHERKSSEGNGTATVEKELGGRLRGLHKSIQCFATLCNAALGAVGTW